MKAVFNIWITKLDFKNTEALLLKKCLKIEILWTLKQLIWFNRGIIQTNVKFLVRI